MQRRIWLALLAVVVALLALPSAARAAGDYGVQTTSSVLVGGSGDPMDCPTADLTTSWGQIMQDTGEFSYQNTWNWLNNYDDAQTKLTDFVTRFQNSLNSPSGTGWAVSQASEFDIYYTSQPEFGTFHKMVRVWAFDPDTTFTLVDGGLQASKTIYYTDYFRNPNGGCRWQAWNYREVVVSWIEFRYNRMLFVNAANITYPSDYTGEPIPTGYDPEPASYVAMGDSFSSGEGNPPFEDGTQEPGTNECHRSDSAYGPLLSREFSTSLGDMAFVACSGATTQNVLGGQWNEPAQIDALSDETETVTITIGGNDVGFRDFATACTLGLCNFSTQAYADIHGKITTELPSKLEEVYAAIDDATPSTARIFVVGYPQIAPKKMPTGMGSFCWPLNGQLDNPSPRKNDGATVYAIIKQLNDVAASAVQAHGSSKFIFVDPNLEGSPFIGHDWCQQDRYFWIVDLPNPISGDTFRAFHPTVVGHNAYKEVIAPYM